MEQTRITASELLKCTPVVDAHMDLAGEIDLRNKNGETDVIKNRYLEQWKKINLKILVSSIYVDNRDLPGNGLRSSLNQIAALLNEIDQNEELMLIRDQKDLETVLNTDKIGILLYMEGLDVISDQVLLLRAFYEMGVRGASLTWSRRNMLAEGCCRAGELRQIYGGLSTLGVQTLKYMEAHHMFIDISHLNDDGFEELMRETSLPVVATHSNARAVQMNYRNLTDEQIICIRERGGMIGLNANIHIVGGKQDAAGLEKMADHVEYLISKAGKGCVGIGLDLCDSYAAAEAGSKEVVFRGDCMKDHTQILDLVEVLLNRGMDTETLQGFLGWNFISYFRRMLPKE